MKTKESNFEKENVLRFLPRILPSYINKNWFSCKTLTCPSNSKNFSDMKMNIFPLENLVLTIKS